MKKLSLKQNFITDTKADKNTINFTYITILPFKLFHFFSQKWYFFLLLCGEFQKTTALLENPCVYKNNKKPAQ